MTRNPLDTDAYFLNDDVTPDDTDATPIPAAESPEALEWGYGVSILTHNDFPPCKTLDCHGQCAVSREQRAAIIADMNEGNADEFDLRTAHGCCVLYVHRGEGFVTVWEPISEDDYRIIAAAVDMEKYEDDDEPEQAAPVEPPAAETPAVGKVEWMHNSESAIAVHGGGLYIVTVDPETNYRLFNWRRLDHTPLRDYDHYKRAWRSWTVKAQESARGAGYERMSDAITAAEAHAQRPAVTDSTLLSGREVAERVQRDGHTLLELQVFGVEHRRTFVVTPDPSGHGTRNEITNAAFDEAVRGLELHLTRSQYGEPTETYTLYRYTNTEKKGRGRR